jgi:hypothetical protein
MSAQSQEPRPLRQWFVATAALLIFIGSLFLHQSLSVQSTYGEPYPPPSNSFIASLEDEINHYRQVLAENNIDEQTRRSIEEKLAIAERIATRVSHPWATVDPLETPQLIPVEDSPFPTGIFEGGGATFRPNMAVMLNRWHGIVNGVPTIVFAGSPTNDPEQGVVFIMRMSGERKSVSWSSYPTPVRSGPVRILSAEGYRLILSTEAGDILYFDVPGDRFVSSLTEVVPTITPQPTKPITILSTPYP